MSPLGKPVACYGDGCYDRIFLRGGVVVQAEENENSVSIVSQSIVNNTTSDEGSMNLTVSKGDSITMSVDIGDSNVEGYHWYNNRTEIGRAHV